MAGNNEGRTTGRQRRPARTKGNRQVEAGCQHRVTPEGRHVAIPGRGWGCA